MICSFGSLIIDGDLKLNGNAIKALPDAFFKVTVGGKLDLSHNQLKTISDAVEDLTVGGDLNLSYNKIETLPSSLLVEKPPKVSGIINLKGNPLKAIPEHFSA